MATVNVNMNVPIVVPDNGGPFDQAYKASTVWQQWAQAAGWTPPAASAWDPVYDMYGAPVRTDMFVGDDYGAHEGPWNGNPGWDWARGARPGGFLPGSNECATWWGQFADETVSWPSAPGGASSVAPNTGVRIQVRDAEMWTAPGPTSPWAKTYTVAQGIGGELADFATFSWAGALGGVRPEPSGGWSFAYTPGSINHIWDGGWPRVMNVPSPTSVFHIRAQLRLITDSGVDLSKVKILGDVSCDWYPTPTAVAQGPEGGIGQPRMRFVTAAWQWFTYTGMTEAQLRANLPPVPAQPLT